MHNHHMDSTLWNDFKFRDDDVVVATYAKSGTTWTQQIVGQLIFNGADIDIAAPLAVGGPAHHAARGDRGASRHRPHRRLVKTHLPVDALVFSPKAKYLYIGRDGRDVVWSMYNHHANANAALVRRAEQHARPRRRRRSSRRRPRSTTISGTGSRRTATRSGRSGRMSAPGGPSATCPTSS